MALLPPTLSGIFLRCSLGAAIICASLPLSLVLGYADHKGTYFVTSFLDVNSTLNPELLIISQVSGAVNVTIRTPNWHGLEPVFLQLNQDASSRVVTLPNGVRMKANNYGTRGIEIQSTADIAIYSLNKSPRSKDATLVLPSDALGGDYVMHSYRPNDNYITKAGIIGVENGTNILVEIPNLNNTIVLKHRGVYYTNGDSFEVRLDKYSTLQLNSLHDMSGIQLNSNVSFALVYGSTYMPNTSSDDDETANRTQGHIEEQLIPTHAWGTTFIAVPFGSYDGGDVFKVISSCDNTTLLINTDSTNISYELSACEAVTIAVENTTETGYIAVTANKPISLIQYYCAKQENESACYPYLVTIPPLEPEDHEYLFSTPDNDSKQLITLVVNSSHAQGLLIDDTPADEYVNSSVWLSVSQGDSNYTAIRLLVDCGYHNISHTQQSSVFSAISQSSPIGLRLENVRSYETPNSSVSEGDTVFDVTIRQRTRSRNSGGQSSGNNENVGGDDGLESNIIAVIVTLGSAVFFVIVCILGFVLNETVFKNGCPFTSNKIAPYVT